MICYLHSRGVVKAERYDQETLEGFAERHIALEISDRRLLLEGLFGVSKGTKRMTLMDKVFPIDKRATDAWTPEMEKKHEKHLKALPGAERIVRSGDR